MANLGHRVGWASVLVVGAALAVGACGDDDTSGPNGTAGRGGTGGEQPTAGQAGSTHAGEGGSGGQGGQGGQAGLAGEGGGGGELGCVDGLQVVKVVKESTRQIISWPEAHRVGVNVAGRGILIYELGEDGGVTLVDTVGPKELGLTEAGSIYGVVRYGSGFIVQGARDGAALVDQRIIKWQPDAVVETIPHPDPTARITITVAEPDIGIAAATRDGVRLATFEGDTWTWSEPFDDGARRSTPLALADGRVLIAIQEADRGGFGGAGNEGGAGAGGAGEDGDAPNARVEWWSLGGERVEAHAAFGNPQVAVKVSEGWVIGETNSFWGSYNAAVELLPTTGALHKLVDVPVISAGDGTDGAHDLALFGDRLLVANCESGLLAGEWSTASVALSSLPGPWQGAETAGNCSPSQIETQGDFAILGGDNVVFARACE